MAFGVPVSLTSLRRKRSVEEVQSTIAQLTQAETDRDEARKLASTAREDAARLRGQVEAMKTQQAALLASLRPTAGWGSAPKPAEFVQFRQTQLLLPVDPSQNGLQTEEK